MSKNYSRRSFISFLVCIPLMLMSIIYFFTHSTSEWILDIVFFQWTTVTFIIGLCYHIINESLFRPTTTRREELIFLTVRLLVILPPLGLVFDTIDLLNLWSTLLTWEGLLCVSSTMCIATLTFFLDKYELEILFYNSINK